MGELDFGIAMLKAKSAVEARLLPKQTIKEPSPRQILRGKKDLGKRIHLIVDSLLKNPSREKIQLPSDKEIRSLRSGGLILKR